MPDLAYRVYKLNLAFRAAYKANEGLNNGLLLKIMELIKQAIREMENK